MLLLAGCRTRTAIADINKDPAHFVGKDVTISGSVSNSFSALGNGIFQVDDGTGQMWVYSQNFGVPGNSGKVSVTGHVEQGFSFAGRSFGVILRQTEAL
jgi:RecJ-like exonuclease